MNLESFEDLLANGWLQPAYKLANEKVKELHTDDCIGFYAKNLLNKDFQTELLYFYNEVIVQVRFTIDKDSYGYPLYITQYNKRIKQKSISVNRRSYDAVELTIDLEDGNSFTFHSVKDSTDDWYGEYAENILSIYKSV